MHFIASLKVTRRQNDDVEGCWETNQPRIVLNYPWKNIFLWVTGTSVMTTQSLQLPKNPAQGFWSPLHLHQFLHSFGLKNSNQFEKFLPVFKKFKPKKNLNHNIIYIIFVSRHLLCIHLLNSVKEGFFSPYVYKVEFFIYAFLYFSPFMKVKENLVKE